MIEGSEPLPAPRQPRRRRPLRGPGLLIQELRGELMFPKPTGDLSSLGRAASNGEHPGPGYTEAHPTQMLSPGRLRRVIPSTYRNPWLDTELSRENKPLLPNDLGEREQAPCRKLARAACLFTRN